MSGGRDAIFSYSLTSKWGRDWNELQSSRCSSSQSHCSSYVRHTSTTVLIAWYQLTYFDAMASLCKMTASSGLQDSRGGIHDVWVGGRHFVYALTSQWERVWKELQSSRCSSSPSHRSSYVQYTSIAFLIAWCQHIFLDAMASLCKMTALSGL
jgi:hypothetical protein